nr:hypothetical protein [Tanacetum cinerariifolium]
GQHPRCPTGTIAGAAHAHREPVDAGLRRLVRQPRRLLDHHVLRALAAEPADGAGLLPLLPQPHQPGVSAVAAGLAAPAAGAGASGPVRRGS